MKKILFLSILLTVSYNIIFAQSDIIERATKSLSEKIIAQAKKNNFKENAKFAVLFFNYSDGNFDTLKTKLGIEFSKKLEHALQTEILKNKLKFEVIVSDTVATAKMNETFFTDPTKNQAQFWKDFLDNITPDYYVVGEFKFENDFQMFKTQNVYIKTNSTLSTKNPDITVDNIFTEISKTEDKTLLISQLQPSNLEQLSMLVAYNLKLLTNIKNVYLKNLTYDQTNMASELSGKLADLMEQDIVNICNYSVRRNSNRGLFSKTDETEYTLNGTYWEDNNYLQLNFKLQNAEGQTIKTFKSKILLSYLQNDGVEFKTSDFEAAKKKIEILETDNNNTEESDFKVDIWTNKGNDNPIFYNGDKATFSVIVSEECYIRLIYIFADDTKVLMLDNYKITAENAGKAYTIPKTFVCAPPFGVETLIINAQTEEPFAELNYKVQGSYKIITDNLNDIVKKNRGFVLEVKKAEKYLTITTLDK